MADRGTRGPSGPAAEPFHIRPRLHAQFYPTELELEFLAEDAVIKIIPNFRSDEEKFFALSGDLGPFTPGEMVQVPLWIGVQLKKLSRCSIVSPSWLQKDFLLQVRQMEKENAVFQDLHPHYLEIATLLLTVAPDDIEDASLIRTIIEDLKNVRSTKIVSGTELTLAQLQDREVGYIPSVVKFNSASAMEINAIRPHFLMMLDTFNSYFPSESTGSGPVRRPGQFRPGAISSASAGSTGTRRKIRRFRT